MDRIYYFFLSVLVFFSAVEAFLLCTHPAKAILVGNYFFLGLIVCSIYKIIYEK
ncbi:MAG: hypothetical protein Q7R43_02905 [Candidatus Daviesbacteria bacterium]|nr:hypothetical protein [Candidatus Daviesbacteria bacterium]